MNVPLDSAALEAQLAELRAEHRALDESISALSADRMVDQLHLQRLKKRKLEIKDRIARLESMRHPDIIA